MSEKLKLDKDMFSTLLAIRSLKELQRAGRIKLKTNYDISKDTDKALCEYMRGGGVIDQDDINKKVDELIALTIVNIKVIR